MTNFLPFDHKRYLEATNNCTQRFTSHNLFGAKWYTLVKWCGCFFTSTKKMASTKKWLHKNVLANANTSWYLPHCISSKWQSMSVTIFNPIKDAYSIWSLKNMLKLAYDNYTWSFPVIISFIRTNTEISGFSKSQLATGPVHSFLKPL